MAKKSPLSEQCIGIPHNLLFAVLGFDGPIEENEAAVQFVLTSRTLSSALVNDVVRVVRATDTPDAYYMDHAFQRAALVDRTRNWTIKPFFAKQLVVLVGAHGIRDAEAHAATLKEVRQLALSLHFKRSRGASVNPLVPQHDIVFVVTKDAGVWFDVTASNDAARHSEGAPTPTRRLGHFAIDALTDARFRTACRCCSNRFTVRLQVCSRCNLARYCGHSCQTKDWAAHRGVECARYRAHYDAATAAEQEEEEEEF